MFAQLCPRYSALFLTTSCLRAQKHIPLTPRSLCTLLNVARAILSAASLSALYYLSSPGHSLISLVHCSNVVRLSCLLFGTFATSTSLFALSTASVPIPAVDDRSQYKNRSCIVSANANMCVLFKQFHSFCVLFAYFWLFESSLRVLEIIVGGSSFHLHFRSLAHVAWSTSPLLSSLPMCEMRSHP